MIPEDTRPQCVIYSLAGSDKGAEQVAEGWFSRMAAASETGEASSTSSQSKTFTVFLRPAVVEHPAYTPIDLPWAAEETTLARVVSGISASLYADGGYPRVWDLMTSVTDSFTSHQRSMLNGTVDPRPNAVAFASLDELNMARGVVVRAFYPRPRAAREAGGGGRRGSRGESG